MEKLLGPEQVQGLLGVKKSTIYKWVHEERIPHLKIGGLLRFREADLERWLKGKGHDPQWIHTHS